LRVDRIHPRTLALGVALLAFASFAPSLGGGFVFDDQLQIVDNDQLRDLRNVPRFFTADVWAAVGLPYSSYYRPLMYTSFAVETALAGPVPWIFRLTNALLHALVSVCVMVLVRRAGGSLVAAAAAGALFALHPMHAEVVAWPSARPDLLTTLFALLAVIAYLGAPLEGGPTRARFVGVGALVMLALLAKESAVAAPVLLGAVVLMRSERAAAWGRIRHGLEAALPFVALIAVFLALRGLVIQVSGSPPLVGDDPLRDPFRTWPEAIVHLFAIAGRYLGTMLVPVEASFFRVPRWDQVAWGLALVPLGIAAALAAPRNRAAAWLAFAFVAIAVQSIAIPSAGYLSQRYAYLPSVGVCAALGELLAAACFVAGASRRRKGLGVAALAVILLAYTGLLLPRAHEWSDEATLWRAAYPRDPDAPAAVTNYAFVLVNEGRAEEALPLFRRVEELEPDSWAAPHGEASALAALGRYEEAIPFFETAIARAPMIPQLRQALAATYEELGDFAKAREVYQEALALFPESALSHGMVGTVLLKAGSDEEALRHLDDALRTRPDQPQLRLNRVIVLARLGRVEEAVAESERMLEEPALAAEAHYNLGILHDRYRADPRRALLHYQEALRRAPLRPNAEQVRRRIATLRRHEAIGE
jgi:protein O-mannosyl-transferase